MTEAQILYGMGKYHLLGDNATRQMLLFAESARRRFGDAAMGREEIAKAVTVDADGRLVPSRPPCSQEESLAGSFAAGWTLARRYLRRGWPPDRVRHEVMGRIRTLARSWQGSEFDKEQRLKECRRGIRKAIRES